MDVRNRSKTRREVLFAAAGLAAAVALPAQPTFATTTEVDELIKTIAGSRKIAEGKVTIDLPSIAENGLVVPLNFAVESPMSAEDYVQAVHIFADGNPHPQVASYTFTPLSPKAAAQLRIRLAKTQTVTVLAVMSNGDVYSAGQEVKVTIGGCGG